MQKEHEIAPIHSKGHQHVGVGRFNDTIAVKVRVANVHGYTSVDNDTTNHLQELENRNEHIDPFWRYADPSSSKGIVGVHEGMYKIVHHHEPLH